MWAAIVGFLKALPAAIQLVTEAVSAGKALIQFVQDSRNEAWFQDSLRVGKQIREAKTDEEKKAAAVEYAKLLGRV